MKSRTKIAALAVSIALLLFIAIDFEYFYKQVEYEVQPPPNNEIKIEPGETDTPNMVWIPSLNISAPITFPQEANETAFQASLKDGVAHYPGTPMPGESGNVYIFGHSSDFIWSTGKYKTVFAVLPRIKIGDEIKITNATGQVFYYKVTKTVIAAPDEVQYLAQDNSKKILTLQTSYPVGTALRRFLAIAELIEK